MIVRGLIIKRCPNCGASTKNTPFCSTCGRPLVQPQPPSKTTKSGDNNTFLIVAVIAIVAIVATGALLATQFITNSAVNNSSNNSNTNANDNSNDNSANSDAATTSTYMMSVLKVNDLSDSYTGLFEYEFQVKVTNNGQSPFSLVANYFGLRTSDGTIYDVEDLDRAQSWYATTIYGKSDATVWLVSKPGSELTSGLLIYDSFDAKFSCNIGSNLLSSASSPWTMSVSDVEYQHYSNEVEGQHYCNLVLTIMNNDFVSLHLNRFGFVGYGTDGFRYDAKHVSGEYWLPFDVAP